MRRRAVRPLRVLISAGPTREAIDPVRFISNYSTGYMAARLARLALRRGHHVRIVSGPVTEVFPSCAKVMWIEQAAQMQRLLRRHARWADVIIMAAAVADFRPAHRVTRKLLRRNTQTLKLIAIPDLIARLPIRRHQIRIGFAVESTRVLARAKTKLRAKRLDLLLAQRLDRLGAPFGRRAVHAWLLMRSGEVISLGRRSKSHVARVLLDKMEALCYGQAGVFAYP